MRHVYTLMLAAAVVGLGGCESVADHLVDARRSDGVNPPTIQVDYGGTFATRGHWDLSRPFGPDGVGGMVAELMIDKIVELAGVPSALHDEARSAIAGQIRQPIVTQVNGAVPAELLASSPTMMALDTSLSDVTVNTELVLVPGSDIDRCTGTDTITNVSVVHADTTYILEIPAISGGFFQVASEISGSATGASTIAIADHEVQLHYGDLVAHVAQVTLGVDVFALAATEWATVSCPAVVDSFTSGAGFTITVAGNTFAVTDVQLETACGELETMLADHALGMFRRDAGLRLGGTIRFTGADALASEPDYDGVIMLFPVVTPQISVSFTGERIAGPASP